METVAGVVKNAQRIQINIAATVFEPCVPYQVMEKTESGIVAPVMITETEEELSQFAAQFYKWPVPEKYIDEAIKNIGNAVKESLRLKGLLK